MAKKDKQIAKNLKAFHKAEATPGPQNQTLSHKGAKRKSAEIAKKLDEMGIQDTPTIVAAPGRQRMEIGSDGKPVLHACPQVKNTHKNLVRKIREMPILTVREFLAIDGKAFREAQAKRVAAERAAAEAQVAINEPKVEAADGSLQEKA